MNRKQRRAGGAPPAGALSPAFVQAFNNGLKLQQEGRLDDAVVAYRQAMRFNPTHPLLHSNLGVVLFNQGKWPEAIAHYQKAIAADPNMPLAHNNLGVALNAADRHDEAIVAFRRSLEFQPNSEKTLNNLADSLNKTSRFAEAKPYLDKTLALAPNYAEAYSNMGMTLWGLGDLDAAIASFNRSIALQPDLAMPHKNLGLVQLLRGEYATAWKEYAHRLEADRIPPRMFPRPFWQGQDLGGKTLLVYAEQGVGDEILYANMMEDLLARGLKIVWECDERLISLFKRSYPAITFTSRTGPPAPETLSPDVVAQCPVGHLGLYFRNDLAKFPKDRTRYLTPDPARVQALRVALNLAPGEKLIGMSWFSKNPRFGRTKSTTLEDWAPIFAVPGTRFVDLQYGDTSADRAALKAKTGLTLAHIDNLDLTKDIDGTAALAAACDLVVTVSNTTAHIAGAVGVPLRVLVPEGMGKLWYWGNNSETTPWYPTARFFRQSALGDWAPIMRQVVEQVSELTHGNGSFAVRFAGS